MIYLYAVAFIVQLYPLSLSASTTDPVIQAIAKTEAVGEAKLPFELKIPRADFSKIKIDEIVLSNETKAWLASNTDVPVISVNILIKDAGFKTDPDTKKGVERIFLAMSDEGAGDLDSDAFERYTNENNIHFSVNDTIDTVNITFQFPKSSLTQGFHLIDLVLTQLKFNEDDLKKVKEHLKLTYKQALENEREIVIEKMAEVMFSDTPYGPFLAKRLDHINNITQKDLRDYVAKYITQDNIIVSVCGNISKEDLKNNLSPIIKKLPVNSSVKDGSTIDAKNLGSRNNIVIDIPQTITLLTHPTINRDHPDYYKIDLAIEIFGGNAMNSRLMTAIREQKGLVYGAYAQPHITKNAPMLMMHAQTRTETTEQVIDLLKNEWQKFIQAGVTQEELDMARKGSIVRFITQLGDTGSIARSLTSMQYHNLGIDYLVKRQEILEKITLADINEALKKHFTSDKLTMFIGGRALSKGAAS